MMPALQITLLGTPTVYIGENPIFQESHTKAQALLYYLVTSGRTHYRNELASLFWPDVPDVQALKNLRNILPVLRARIGEHLLVTRHTVTFNRYTSYRLDVEMFESLLGVAPSQANTDALWEAAALYNDDFLNGFYVRNAPLFEEWMLLKRQRLRDLFIDVLQTLATRHLQQQDCHAVLKATRRLLSMAPWHENGHQQQMQALVGLGQPSAALAQYTICCRILAAEFNVAPNEETTRIYQQIKTASFGPATDLSLLDAVPPAAPVSHAGQDDPTAVKPASAGASPAVSAGTPPPALNADGTLLAVPDTPSTIRLESLATRRHLHGLSGHTAAITALSFSPTDHILASADADGMVRLWDATSGMLLATLVGHTDAVTALSFSPTGQILASAGSDQTVRLWDTSDGTPCFTLQGHMHPVVHVVFVPDGTRLVSIDTNHVVRLWHVTAHHNFSLYALSLNA